MLAILHDNYRVVRCRSASSRRKWAGQPGGTGWHGELFGLCANGLVQLRVRPPYSTTTRRCAAPACAGAGLARAGAPTCRRCATSRSTSTHSRHLAGCLDGEYDHRRAGTAEWSTTCATCPGPAGQDLSTRAPAAAWSPRTSPPARAVRAQQVVRGWLRPGRKNHHRGKGAGENDARVGLRTGYAVPGLRYWSR